MLKRVGGADGGTLGVQLTGLKDEGVNDDEVVGITVGAFLGVEAIGDKLEDLAEGWTVGLRVGGIVGVTVGIILGNLLGDEVDVKVGLFVAGSSNTNCGKILTTP